MCLGGVGDYLPWLRIFRIFQSLRTSIFSYLQNKSPVHRLNKTEAYEHFTTQHRINSRQRAAGKIFLFGTPSRESVRYFFNQEGATTRRTFLLPGQDKRESKKKPMIDWPHTTEDKRKLPSKSRSDNLDWNVRDIQLLCYTPFYASQKGSVSRTDFSDFSKNRPSFWFG